MNAPRILTLSLVAAWLAACEPTGEPLMVGTLERDRIELKTESSEPIVLIAVDDGSPVRGGDLVLSQDPQRAEARLAQAQAERDRAAARLAELRRGPRREAIGEAQARLQASEVLTRNARTEFERAEEIFQRGLSTASVRDHAEAAWRAAAAREQADREALGALLTGTTVEELQQAQAQLAAAEALVNQRRLDAARLDIRAPVDGVIDKVLYELGERPAAGATVAIELDAGRSYARIYVPHHLRSRIKPGVHLDILIDGAESTRDGTVRWVSSDASFTPYFALTEHDRSRLSYLAEVDVEDAGDLPAGIPLEARMPPSP